MYMANGKVVLMKISRTWADDVESSHSSLWMRKSASTISQRLERTLQSKSKKWARKLWSLPHIMYIVYHKRSIHSYLAHISISICLWFVGYTFVYNLCFDLFCSLLNLFLYVCSGFYHWSIRWFFSFLSFLFLAESPLNGGWNDYRAKNKNWYISTQKR